MSEKIIKIVLAEDHRLVRKALKTFLEEQFSFKVVAEAGNGKELLETLKRVSTDIVLLDIEMPVMNGKQALSVICKQYPDIKVIMLSLHNEKTLMAEFLSMGARAFISKTASEEALCNAINNVYRLGYYFDQDLSLAMLRELQIEKTINPLMDEQSLSRRETEILKELCHGKTNKEIADCCNITMTTVNFHRTNIYKKTKSHNITDLIKYGIKNGMIPVN
jgi:DNA-binding NarL/FixJ family response regulator